MKTINRQLVRNLAHRAAVQTGEFPEWVSLVGTEDVDRFAWLIVNECIKVLKDKQDQIKPNDNTDPDLWKKFYAQDVLGECIGEIRKHFELS